MFNLWLDYPTLEEEYEVVKQTTIDKKVTLNKIISAEEITYFQQLVRKIPVANNVIEYAVKLAVKTRPTNTVDNKLAQQYLSWGAGPRASQYLVLGAKCHAALNGKYSPDIEDVKAVAHHVLRHRIVRNYKAEADGMSVENIISKLL
jgi:MoxR-like ATPase